MLFCYLLLWPGSCSKLSCFRRPWSCPFLKNLRPVNVKERAEGLFSVIIYYVEREATFLEKHRQFDFMLLWFTGKIAMYIIDKEAVWWCIAFRLIIISKRYFSFKFKSLNSLRFKNEVTDELNLKVKSKHFQKEI